MVTIVVNAHRRVHLAVALDEAGRKLGVHKIASNAESWRELYEWACEVGDPRQ